ncbi:hypothetical protein A1O3_02393 [Capronia epimyces CBS 606.96]|uniref:FAD-binding FR-type domain-containing protein n=1 Tax=Capronia epimyces CBS 606.96 TaxID=1182542 RepID=W9YJA0_9EURO|nr:uncharacterized protein A1O3_02393 [Capronia epimyces CBS 606.96]EXJ89326.1 hypothetical protein A1O3_02393 [Capronia epimyces CBS 606.96]
MTSPATKKYLDGLNKSLPHNYLYAMAGLVLTIYVLHSLGRLKRHVRHLASLNGQSGAHRLFASTSPSIAWLKGHVLYAPMFKYRRATETRIGSRISLGSLPTRLQGLFLFFLVAFNVMACVWQVPWSSPELQVLPILRNRTGTLATANLIPICVLATIKNPLINALEISYDSFNLVHRWMGRLSILQGLAHTLCWMIAKVQKGGWTTVTASFTHSSFIYTGLIATVGFTVIGLQSPKMFRSLAYEFFLHSHIILVAMAFAGLWIHLKQLPQQAMLLAAILIWVVSRLWRLATTIYRSCGHGGSKAVVVALPSGAVKIQLFCARPWKVKNGQTLYLSIPSVGLWTAHPFSVAWGDTGSGLTGGDVDSVESNHGGLADDKIPIFAVREVGHTKETDGTIHLIVKRQTGFTRKLFEKAQEQRFSRVTLNAYIEGPYGHEKSMASFGTVLLFASGVGITHQMLYVKELVQGFADGTVATQQITLVWVVPDAECLEWVRAWMSEILGMEKRREVLKVFLYITRSSPVRGDFRSSANVRICRGRPNVADIILAEARERTGAMAVSVCASGSLSDHVRQATRLAIGQGVNASFAEEGFGW